LNGSGLKKPSIYPWVISRVGTFEELSDAVVPLSRFLRVPIRNITLDAGLGLRVPGFG
jgi:hypothetical protein